MNTLMCPCGMPAHYATAERRIQVEAIIAEKGELVTVLTTQGAWRVPRRYIALHGFKAMDIPYLAAYFGWAAATDEEANDHA
jgi:hypothetical protein